jgi:hypothetical protein
MDDAYRVRLSHFNFRPKEKFIYTYNYYDDWQLEIRLEECLLLDCQKTYPLCVAGKRAASLDDDGGPWRFMEFRHRYSIWEINERLLEIADDEDLAENRDYYVGEMSNYYRYVEPISTAFVESTVNEVISRRMVKKQQMRWTKKGAHLLLQVRTRALNDDLKDTLHKRGADRITGQPLVCFRP